MSTDIAPIDQVGYPWGSDPDLDGLEDDLDLSVRLDRIESMVRDMEDRLRDHDRQLDELKKEVGL